MQSPKVCRCKHFVFLCETKNGQGFKAVFHGSVLKSIILFNKLIHDLEYQLYLSCKKQNINGWDHLLSILVIKFSKEFSGLFAGYTPLFEIAFLHYLVWFLLEIYFLDSLPNQSDQFEHFLYILFVSFLLDQFLLYC